MTITEKHVLFWGDWPSNFAWAPMVFKCPDGVTRKFFSSEQCFMWHKAYHFKDAEIMQKILDLNFKEADSYKAKKLGRHAGAFLPARCLLGDAHRSPRLGWLEG